MARRRRWKSSEHQAAIERQSSAAEHFTQWANERIAEKMEELAAVDGPVEPREIEALFDGIPRQDLDALVQLYAAFDRGELLSMAELQQCGRAEGETDDAAVEVTGHVPGGGEGEEAKAGLWLFDFLERLGPQTRVAFKRLIQRGAARVEYRQARHPRNGKRRGGVGSVRWRRAAAGAGLTAVFMAGTAIAPLFFSAPDRDAMRAEIKAEARAEAMDAFEAVERLREVEPILRRLYGLLADDSLGDPKAVLNQIETATAVAMRQLDRIKKGEPVEMPSP